MGPPHIGGNHLNFHGRDVRIGRFSGKGEGVGIEGEPRWQRATTHQGGMVTQPLMRSIHVMEGVCRHLKQERHLFCRRLVGQGSGLWRRVGRSYHQEEGVICRCPCRIRGRHHDLERRLIRRLGGSAPMVHGGVEYEPGRERRAIPQSGRESPYITCIVVGEQIVRQRELERHLCRDMLIRDGSLAHGRVVDVTDEQT